MTAGEFRKIAPALPGAVESAHMNHPDFRMGEKIFATLGYPDKESGMVKLPAEVQRTLVQTAPDAFHLCNGAWGKRGCTDVNLAAAPQSLVKKSLHAATKNALVAQSKK